MSTKRVLILTPSLGLGELIRQVLGDIGDYAGVLAFTEEEGLGALEHEPADLAVVDTELGTETLETISAQLRAASPHMHFILISHQGDRANFEGLEADHMLPNPFYLPDLIAAIEEIFGPSPEPVRAVDLESPPQLAGNRPPEQGPAPAWLTDLKQAAQHLARLSLESSSQAALITHDGKVWASAGELSQPATEELAATIAQYAGQSSATDVARFIHLESTNADYMLYATGLAEDFVLAVVFDAEVPFSTIRSQAGELARALARAPEMAVAEPVEVGAKAQIMEVFAQLEREDQFGPLDFVAEASEGGLGREFSGAGLPPAQSAETAAQIGADADQQGDGNLLFTYVLIPRLPNHRLEGDLAAKLGNWLPLLCVAYGWRLEHLSVQKHFLQWTVALSTETPPARVARVAEAYLSEHIFVDFPRIQKQNPSGEFWAPGALILSGAQPSPEQISAFIQRTRAKQGIPSDL